MPDIGLPTTPEEWDAFDLEAWVKAQVRERMRPLVKAARQEEEAEEQRILYGDPTKANATGVLRVRMGK